MLFSRRVLTTGREVGAGASDGRPTVECGWSFVLRPSEAPAAGAQDGPVRAEGAEAPWWSQLYGSVRATDRPGSK